MRRNRLPKLHSVRYQNLFLHTHWMRRWVLLVGEGVAVVSSVMYFAPGLPKVVDDLAIPVAVLSGAVALLAVAMYDKFDPTVMRICALNEETYNLLEKRGQIQQDVFYALGDNFPRDTQ